ncbi:MAG: polyisoprenoid-binding protein [Bdellovibrionaceae bacterium]|nr:polyisoprenoid-binding protein [Pseudobdellovibrionaceae bacterium]
MRFLALALFTFSLSAWAQVTHYKVDPTHASIVFKVSHLGFANVYGMIGGVDGKFTIDEKAPEKSSIEVSAKVETLNTMDKKRDEHLRGPDFFNVKQYPTIILKSTKVKKSGDNYEVTADLTLHGVTKPVTFTFHQMKTGKDPWNKFRTGGETVFSVRRTDYNMTYMSKPGEIGDDVELRISLEGIKDEGKK